MNKTMNITKNNILLAWSAGITSLFLIIALGTAIGSWQDVPSHVSVPTINIPGGVDYHPYFIFAFVISVPLVFLGDFLFLISANFNTPKVNIALLATFVTVTTILTALLATGNTLKFLGFFIGNFLIGTCLPLFLIGMTCLTFLLSTIVRLIKNPEFRTTGNLITVVQLPIHIMIAFIPFITIYLYSIISK